MAVISAAIRNYHRDYGFYPVSDEVRRYSLTSGANGSAGDVTYGGAFDRQNGLAFTNSPVPPPALADNREVMAILQDYTAYPVSGLPTANAGHLRNTNKFNYLCGELPVSAGKTGTDIDLACRDPWGNPYVITMNLKGDVKCMDALYRCRAVSQKHGGSGHLGFTNAIDPGGNGDNFSRLDDVLVWSLGPDGKADPTIPANQGVNADNVLSR
jgi:hypothetical protein